MGHLIDKEKLFKEASDYYKAENTAKYKETLKKALYDLGYSLHPIQDLPGHGDDYVKYTRNGGIISWGRPIGIPVWNHGGFTEPTTGADEVGWDKVVKHGIRYYHWDDVIWTRDLTYDLIGRFYKEYKNLL